MLENKGLKGAHFGAVYFRKSNPPEKDWKRDYKVAKEDGHTIFRHWFPWGAIETSSGTFDWKDYDQHLDLAAQNNIKTVIAEFIDLYPEWLFNKFPRARRENIKGEKSSSNISASCVTGGIGSMCLDNPEIEYAAEQYLRELANRYKDHPGLYAYDVWNECNTSFCYCPATENKFRKWLKNKYGDLATLNEAWFRYSFSCWDDVHLPREIAPYPEVFDAIKFQNDRALQWMKWRVDIIKEVDAKHPVTAHGNARSFSEIANRSGDDWRAGEIVDIFGYTYWHANECHPLLAGDMIRSASTGKQFWRAEAVGDSEWTARTPEKNPLEKKDELSQPENIRLDAMMSLMAGARVYLNPRWRPLLDGPLFGAYGWYEMDGSRTERSEMVAKIAEWAHKSENNKLWEAQPIKGDIALLLLEDSQIFNYAYYGNTDFYAQSLQGAYEAFLDSNIQCDIIKLKQIDEYDIIYVPYPVAIGNQDIEKIKRWVKEGGCLISEACFGYFDEKGHAFPEQPNRGFLEIFGCQENTVSFAPDKWRKLEVKAGDLNLKGALYRQSYKVLEGKSEIEGNYNNGETAIVANNFEKGHAQIVGTMPGYFYNKRGDDSTREWFASLLSYANSQQVIAVDKPNIVGRLCKNTEDEYFVWAINFDEQEKETLLTINDKKINFNDVKTLRGRSNVEVNNKKISVQIQGKDATVVKLV